MDDQVLGLTADGIRRTAETNRRVLDSLPDVGRRTRRVFPGGASAGNSVINFTILDWFPAADPATFACDCVLAEVTRTSCATIAQVGDEVLVCDPNLCWFNLPIELLVGSRGRADWMSIDGVTATLECPTLLYQFGITDCLWICSDLCCREEIYA